jgi:hemerythrin
MPILWRPQMSLGNDLIDADHRYLIALINTVELALKTPGEREALVTALDHLVFYTQDHFAREEKLMLSLHYPGYEEHRRSHRRLASELVELRGHVEALEAGTTAAQDVDRLIGLLRSWLLDHVLKEDMLLKPLLSAHAEQPAG